MQLKAITYTLLRDYIPLTRITYQVFGLDKTKHRFRGALFLARCEGHGFATQILTPWGIASADLFAKNSPPDCFLNAKTLSGFESLLTTQKNNTTQRVMLFLARCEGLEPPTYWFVASHSIQLS